MAVAMGEQLQSRVEDDISPLQRKEPMKKMLPSVPDPQLSTKTEPRPTDNPAYGPYFLEYALLAEYTMVQRQKLTGIYVVPAACTALQWFGVLFVRQGYYQGGVFRFILYIPDDYPDGDCPRVIFEPAVFHPLIDMETGELDLTKGFQKWRRNVNHLWQVLLYTKRVFNKIQTTSPVNTEAALLYDKDIESFKQRVSESIQQCGSKILEPPSNDDPHAIRFSPWDNSIHEQVRRRVLSSTNEDEGTSRGGTIPPAGLSWMERGSLRTFGKHKSAS